MTQDLAIAVASGDCWNRIGIAGDHSCPELPGLIHCRNCPVFAAAAGTFFDRPAPPGYLDAWADQLSGAHHAASDGGTTASVLIFRLRQEWLALDTKVVHEVTSPRPVHRIPHRSNGCVAGLVNLRGQLYLCASLHTLLGVEQDRVDARTAVARMVVIRQKGELWVFPAEEVLGVHHVPRDRLRAVPSTLANPAVSFSQAVFAWNEHSVGYLDPERVFSGLRSLAR
jgi:chemotaxis-related protein WspD